MKKALFTLSQALLLLFTKTPLAFATQHELIINITPPGEVVPPGLSIDKIVTFIITALVVVGIIAALIFLIIGAIQWVASGGSKEKVEAARNHVVAAIVGLVIIILAFVIINVIFQVITGKPFTGGFVIPTLGQP